MKYTYKTYNLALDLIKKMINWKVNYLKKDTLDVGVSPIKNSLEIGLSPINNSLDVGVSPIR